jgi:hypothetical protein
MLDIKCVSLFSKTSVEYILLFSVYLGRVTLKTREMHKGLHVKLLLKLLNLMEIEIA